MRNLKNVRLAEVQLQNDLPLTATAWDTTSDAIVCTFGPAQDNAVIELRRKRHDAYFSDPVGADVFECIASWDAPCPLPDLACDRVLSLHYFADNLTACLVLEGGDIIIVREEPLPGEDKIEILGSVDVGITAAAWSPDEELLAITTRANTFLYMTRDFENVADITFTPQDLQASQHVSVGWGKRETQFQGKRAKALRDPTVPEKFDEGKLSNNDDASTTITWRGDGAYVAVNSIEAGNRRVIRVYSREGTIDSVSEPVDGLEGALSWRPYGNLIAGIQRLDDRVDVVFFERNGLRHGEFTLRLTDEERASWASNIHLSWNIDSTVLAVQFKDRVQFWTMGNYHYYLKQEVPVTVSPEYSTPFSFTWHQEKALRFVAGASVSMLDVDFVFDVHHGSTLVPDDVGAVAVIDGKTLKLTPLRLSGVPPPMAHNELALDSNAIDVAFSKSGSRIAVLMKDHFSVFLWSLKSKPVACPILESSYPLSPDSRPRQIAFLNENEVYVLKTGPLNNAQIEHTALESRLSKIAYEATDSEQLFTLFPTLGHESLWFSHVSQPGRPISYSSITLKSPDELEVSPWVLSPTVDTYWARAAQISEDEHVLISMTRTGALYANKTLLAKNCTSFVVTTAHVLFTTSQHLLKFVHLDNPEILSRLSEDDVSQTLYKDTLKVSKPEAVAAAMLKGNAPASTNKLPSKGSKVNRICDAFLATLEKRLDTNLQNLVTAHVCKSPPDLDAGLQLVARLREKSSEQAQDAIEHMCFLSDANRLYDHALGLHDLELTLLVAQQAQRVRIAYKDFSHISF
ncbi:hypothetical protein ASPWEDRAFT_247455 [Aspergillus wentii DTO 134E9]|uniref:Elongator complex protein 1 n=1 Tax=Aspergillus wentii DTO 134E9 TaxID=1073089 RepID=A0A1L9S1W7_ASPWE|nr:uncharacterized protein ASPWEDRAFT_247455 [Aspergillus wentii DTO 134E9]OJJ41142.1 hypothetical protein ASPWEDRAFT_247455 [Aspergillus wentii DTO 134E9]